MRSVSDCLNFSDIMMLCSIKKHVGLENLEDVRDSMIEMYMKKNTLKRWLLY